MRTSILAVLLLSGCLDFESLYHGSAVADMPGSGDLSGHEDLATSGKSDMANPVYWVSTFSGGAGAKALRGIGGAGGTILAVGDMGTCLLSTNGTTFAAQNTNTNTNFTAVWASSATNAWLVGNGGAQINQYNGQSFPGGTAVPNLSYTAVYGANAAQIIAVSTDKNNGAQYNSAQTQWMAQNHSYNAAQNGMWGMPNGNRLWTVGANATGGYFDVMMNQWAAKQTIGASASNITFRSVWGTSDTDVWAVGDQGNISHYSNGSFTQVQSNTNANLRGI